MNFNHVPYQVYVEESNPTDEVSQSQKQLFTVNQLGELVKGLDISQHIYSFLELSKASIRALVEKSTK